MKITYEEILKIIENNCEEIPYEGTEVDKGSMAAELFNLINNQDDNL